MIDFGLPGPDRGEGGRFLLVPPGYDGSLPDSGFHVGGSPNQPGARPRAVVPDGRRSGADRRNHQAHHEGLSVRPRWSTGRAWRRCSEGGDVRPAPLSGGPRDGVRRREWDGYQHGAAERLRLLRVDGRGRAGRARRQRGRRAPGAAGCHRDRQGHAVRARRADAAIPRRWCRSLLRHLARPFPRPPSLSEGFAHYDDVRHGSTCCGSGGTRSRRRPRWSRTEGFEPFPATGVRKLHSRTSFLYAATGVTPAMCMRITGLGSQYLMAALGMPSGEPLRWCPRPIG